MLGLRQIEFQTFVCSSHSISSHLFTCQRYEMDYIKWPDMFDSHCCKIKGHVIPAWPWEPGQHSRSRCASSSCQRTFERSHFGEPLFANCDFAARDFCSSVLWHFYTWEWLSTIGWKQIREEYHCSQVCVLLRCKILSCILWYPMWVLVAMISHVNQYLCIMELATFLVLRSGVFAGVFSKPEQLSGSFVEPSGPSGGGFFRNTFDGAAPTSFPYCSVAALRK